MTDLLHSVAGTAVGVTVAKSQWMFAAGEVLHFIGLFILVGSIGALDLRVLGFWKEMPVAPLHRLVPLAIFGFAINLLTGIMFFLVDPVGYGLNPAFQVKMVLILIAGANALCFKLLFSKSVESWGPYADSPRGAKIVCGLSLLLWACVIVAGRLFPSFSFVL